MLLYVSPVKMSGFQSRIDVIWVDDPHVPDQPARFGQMTPPKRQEPAGRFSQEEGPANRLAPPF
jgi:hypothetical protein